MHVQPIRGYGKGFSKGAAPVRDDLRVFFRTATNLQPPPGILQGSHNIQHRKYENPNP